MPGKIFLVTGKLSDGTVGLRAAVSTLKAFEECCRVARPFPSSRVSGDPCIAKIDLPKREVAAAQSENSAGAGSCRVFTTPHSFLDPDIGEPSGRIINKVHERIAKLLAHIYPR